MERRAILLNLPDSFRRTDWEMLDNGGYTTFFVLGYFDALVHNSQELLEMIVENQIEAMEEGGCDPREIDMSIEKLRDAIQRLIYAFNEAFEYLVAEMKVAYADRFMFVDCHVSTKHRTIMIIVDE